MARIKPPSGRSPDAGERNEHQELKDKYGFEPTLWTELVGPAGSPDETVRFEALSKLLEKYQTPLKAFLRAALAKYGVQEDWINDCFQSFVLEKVMKKELIQKADRERGPFRNFLKTSLYRFAIQLWRGEREPMEPLPPEIEDVVRNLPLDCDIEWARDVLQQALAKMFADCLAKKQQIIWTIFEQRRLGTLLHGAEVELLADTVAFVKQTCGVTLSDQAISNRQLTGDEKFDRCIGDVLSEYCRDAEEIESERQAFIKLLRAMMQGHAR